MITVTTEILYANIAAHTELPSFSHKRGSSEDQGGRAKSTQIPLAGAKETREGAKGKRRATALSISLLAVVGLLASVLALTMREKSLGDHGDTDKPLRETGWKHLVAGNLQRRRSSESDAVSSWGAEGVLGMHGYAGAVFDGIDIKATDRATTPEELLARGEVFLAGWVLPIVPLSLISIGCALVWCRATLEGCLRGEICKLQDTIPSSLGCMMVLFARFDYLAAERFGIV